MQMHLPGYRQLGYVLEVILVGCSTTQMHLIRIYSWDVCTGKDISFMFSNSLGFNLDISSWNVNAERLLFQMFLDAYLMYANGWFIIPSSSDFWV